VQTTNLGMFLQTLAVPAVARLCFDVVVEGQVGDELALLMAEASRKINRDDD